ncbi:MAG: PQQ-dependent sugar dehydrogenase [Bacteroidota bacterium]
MAALNHPLLVRCVVLFLFLGFQINAQVEYAPAYPDISFAFPVEIQPSVDGSNRMFVVEQSGTIKVFDNSPDVQPSDVSVFLDISDRIVYSDGQEIGLLGLAFHPNFNQNGYFYVYFTDRPSNYRINIARYQVSNDNLNQADASTETLIASFEKNQPESNHNGGKIAFGPDGYLYASIGDGGGGGDPEGNAQDLETIFGSIIRIDIDLDGNNPVESNPELPNGNYEIPSDNPRVGLSGLDELYAWGIRNTWKFSFSPSGQLWGADVGQGNFEEVNIITLGSNYGWNKFEALDEPSYGNNTDLATTPDIKPIHFYNHNNGDVSITGGYFYQGSLSNTLLQDKYIFGDYVSGRVWALDHDPNNGQSQVTELFKTNGNFVSSFGLDEAGELYFSDYSPNAQIYKFSLENNGPQTRIVEGIGNWNNLDTGTDGPVQGMTLLGADTFVIGGEFNTAGNALVNNLAQNTNFSLWEALGTGTNGPINALLTLENGDLIAAGDFTEIDGVAANRIALWNGQNWNALGTGTNGPIAALEVGLQNQIYVGGVFTQAGGQTVNNIAMWSNGVWMGMADLDTGITGTNNEIRALKLDSDGWLYVGGNFDSAGGKNTPRIARWNGQIWEALGVGTSGFVQALSIEGNDVFVGGNFVLAGGQTVNRIARWEKDSKNWFPLNNGVSGNVNTLEHDGDYLYVGGAFETVAQDNATNDRVANIARWNIAQGWQALGTETNVGVDNIVRSMIFNETQDTLLVGGSFQNAGNVTAANIAYWSNDTCTANPIVPEYQIDGVWQSGSESLVLDEGTTLVLSILPNTEDFNVTAPDGTTSNGDLNLGALVPNQAGVYRFISSEGCRTQLTLSVTPANPDDTDADGVPDAIDNCPNTPQDENVDANGCSSSQLDDDNDGVNNNQDECPNTPQGRIVDSEGCILAVLPADTYIIRVTSTSCVGAAQGVISIQSQQPYVHPYTLTSSSGNRTGTFEGETQFENLAPGTYELCLSVQDNPQLEQCSTIVVSEPDPIAVEVNRNEVDNSVTLKLSGSNRYYIRLNTTEFITESGQITLPLAADNNQLEVRGDKNCQGLFSQNLNTQLSKLILYPNPASEYLELEQTGLNQFVQPTVRIYSQEGKLLFEQTMEFNGGETLRVPVDNLNRGIYFLQIQESNVNQVHKFIKS